MRNRVAVAAVLAFTACCLAPAPARAGGARLGPPIRVRWTYPQVGLSSVFSDEVVVRFNRPVDPESVGGGSVQLLSGGYPVPGTASLLPGGRSREVVFIPDAPLFRDTSYTIRVTAGLRSLRGRALSPEFTGGFSTSPFKDGVKPIQGGDFRAGPSLLFGRAFHTADAFPGGVVIAGGQTLDGTPLGSTEVMVGDLFHRAGDLETARRKHASVTLGDGTVLVCGGFGPTGGTIPTAELFNPATETWTSVPPMNEDRANHAATLLSDGKVLVTGGFTNRTGVLAYTAGAEVFNPYQRTWTALPGMAMARGGHTATLLADGRVLVTGGERYSIPGAELFDPAPGTFRLTAAPPAEHRIFHAAVRGKSGNVLLAGGGPGMSEEYDPLSESFRAAGSAVPPGVAVSDSPYFATLTRLDERLMFLGGLSVGGDTGGTDLVLDSVRLWTASGASGSGRFYEMPLTLAVPRAAHTVTPRGDGSWLVVGGFGTEGSENERRTTILVPTQ